jgi:hypothetical protein
MSKLRHAFLFFLIGMALIALLGSLALHGQDFSHIKKNGVDILAPNYPLETGQTVFFGGGGFFGGVWNKRNPADTYLLQLEDSDAGFIRVLGFNMEQQLQRTGTVTDFSFGNVTELWTPLTDSATYTAGQQTSLYGSFSHFGSGSLFTGAGVEGEAFNPGPSTVTLLIGAEGTANCGGTVAGVPNAQTPTNNGTCTNIRAMEGATHNFSSGVVTNAVGFFADTPTNSGGGTITNAYGLFISDQTVGTNKWAIRTGVGKVEFGDIAVMDSTLNVVTTVGVGSVPVTSIGLLINNSNLATANQFGADSAPVTSSAATFEGSAFVARADTAAASFTQALNTGLHVLTPNVGAGSTITEWDGILINPAPTAGTKCSIKISGSTSGSTCINTSAAAGGTAAAIISTSFTTTAATTDNVTVIGMTSSGHCALEPTNSAAAAGITSVFVSAKATNQITVTHTATAGWTFDVMCSPI